MNSVVEARCTSDPQPAEGKIAGSMALAAPLEHSSAGGHAVAPGAEQSAPAAHEKCCGSCCGESRMAAIKAENAQLRQQIAKLETDLIWRAGVIADCVDKLNPKGASPCLN